MKGPEARRAALLDFVGIWADRKDLPSTPAAVAERPAAPAQAELAGVLIDSGVLIEVARRRNPSLLAPWEALAADPTQGYYSPVSAAEEVKFYSPR